MTGCLGQALSLLYGAIVLLGLLATLFTPRVTRAVEQAEERVAELEIAEEPPPEPIRLVSAPSPDRHPPIDGPAPAPGTPAFRQALVDLMARGLRFTGSSANIALREGVPTIFDGSYDWHSCVIANWALLTDARWAGEPDRVADLVARATPQALRRELRFLVDRRRQLTFTRPYDEAWFALYLAELQRHIEGPRADAVRDVRIELEAHLRAWMEVQPFPERLFEDEGPAVCGFYRSWAWAWLLLSWSEPVTEDLRTDLARWSVERIEPALAAMRAQTDAHPIDFLYVPAVAALIERLDRDVESADVPYAPGSLADWPERVRIATVHVLGIEISRTWPLAIDGARGDAAARELQRERIASLLARDDLWRGDFDAVSHWIPQYLWIGLWLEADRP